MAENSAIEWTHHTFNPWRGCTGPNGARVVAAESQWKQPLKWDREAEKAGERRRVFCASLADVFEDWDGVMRHHSYGDLAINEAGDIWPSSFPSMMPNADDWGVREYTIADVRRRLFQLIDDTPHLDWLLLTKRPENIRRMWPRMDNQGHGWHKQNVWLGTSVENQEQADKRIPELLKCRDLSPVLFLSCEPLLGPVDLHDYLWAGELPQTRKVDGKGIVNWLICGGESGHHARPMHPEWARSLRDQCQAAGVPFFFKQWGEWALEESEAQRAYQEPRLPWADSGDLCPMYNVGKKAAGRLLDGREWNEFPEVLS